VNTYAALERAVLELMEEIEAQNDIDPREIVSATFSATTDIDVVFPAKIARSRSHWEHVPLLDVQQMYVKGSLERCIRVLIHVNTPLEQHQIKHVYLNGARDLRPDLVYAEI
ncbi:MAG: chorismate mutase, partial [Pseudanabaena sp.]